MLCMPIAEGWRIRGTCSYFVQNAVYLTRVVSCSISFLGPPALVAEKCTCNCCDAHSVLRTGCDHGLDHEEEELLLKRAKVVLCTLVILTNSV